MLLKRVVLKTLGAFALLGVVGLVILFALLWREHKTAITLPEPTGQFAVGRATYTWANNAETDELAPSPGTKREVVVWIWYPAANTKPAVPVEYLPSAWRSALAQYSGVLMSDFFTRDLSLVRAHSISDPNVSPAQSLYPVVIMRAGSGALTTNYTTLAENLASHGYIVAGLDAPHRTSVVVLPDKRVVTRPPQNDPENLPSNQANLLANRLLPMWTDDIKFVVSQLQHLNNADPSGRFTGRLDMERLGIFGHSFGGAQALQFCHDDARCKAGINLDGAPFGSVVQDGLKQPFMFILSDHRRDLADPASRLILANFQSIYSRLANGRVFIAIRGANHFTFSDQMLIKSPLLIGLLHMAGNARLDGRRGLAITAEYVRTFFDVYLKGAPPSLLTDLSKQYPEVETNALQLYLGVRGG